MSLLNLQIDRNVGKTERIISAVAGSLLMVHGMTRGKRLSEMSLGSYLLFRAATGMCPIKNKLAPAGIVGTGLKTIQDSTHHNINLKSSTNIAKPRAEVYAFWRKLENLPLFMKHLESVTVLDETTSLWKANIPGGLGTIEWKSEIVHDEFNNRIGWKSLPGSEIMNVGNVQFKDTPTGTKIETVLSYDPPAGKIGETVASLLTPIFEGIVKSDLQGIKKYMEGTTPTVRMPSGKGTE